MNMRGRVEVARGLLLPAVLMRFDKCVTKSFMSKPRVLSTFSVQRQSSELKA